MCLEYCKGCKRECDYIEVQKFIEYINQEFNKCYCLKACPDKAKKDYTCDLLYKDCNSKELMFVEVKRIELGVGPVCKKNKLLASYHGQEECKKIIGKLVDEVGDEDKIRFFNDCVINIPLVQLGNKDIEKLKKEFAQFISKIEVNDKTHQFNFEFKEKNIRISLRRKDNDLSKKFGYGTLWETDTEEENALSQIFEKMRDTSRLRELIYKNFKETSSKKYPKNSKQRILLNVLQIPPGYEFFFNYQLDIIIRELNEIKTKNSFVTTATEGYFLYYCNDFFKFDEKWNITKRYKNALVIKSLLGNRISQTVVFYGN